ncbi:Crp/Fnr family transcriptional regulator [Methylomonas methanica]|uniref:Transcriptional regulator, Crp/Fnr family n=1 Tax=Methylomonas methanica (strain DSM 25384 / MC09) TaxID=857087 RepID=F9ZXU0_METMM|nr:Crp/Fnr family transcriptional regulator [Methylomonas methanica]AEF98519.1 transcriptional regulator, Crp/Fnr family [Methylomonas methanica MC09]
MPTNRSFASANQLLAALPSDDLERLLFNSKTVELGFAEILSRAGQAVPHVYFPISSYVSLVTPVNNDTGLEVGLIGTEGMLGITLILGIDASPFEARVQGAGSALRMDSDVFLKEFERCSALQQTLKRYLYVNMSQLGQAAACNRYHRVEARLARWLLMTHDRAHADTFHVTHIFLAYILGVRRVGITKAAYSLQQQKLISYRRGDITILNRSGLEDMACSCYQIDQETYRRVLD